MLQHISPSSINETVFDEYPHLEGSCRLLGPTALVVQAILGYLVILSLVYKRHRETPKRPWRIWVFDVGKQSTGQVFVHGVNLLISGVVARLSSGNACVFYFLNILIDTTLGVGIIYFLLKFFTVLLTERFNFEGFKSGQYGLPPSPSYWVRQTAVYVLCQTLMKVVVVGIFVMLPVIFDIGEWLLSWIGEDESAQVVFVMGVFPIIMNIVQFWLLDSVVKAKEQLYTSLPPPTSAHSQAEEPLLRVEDEDDSDTNNSTKHDIENPPLQESLGVESSLPARILTPGPVSGSVTPLEVGNHDVALHRYQNSSPSSRGLPLEIPTGDEWEWDESHGEE